MKNKSMNAFIVLHNGKQVLKSLYLRILLQIDAVKSQLKRGKEYTARELCGDEFWSSLEKKECLLAGSCIVHMAAEGDLPLVNVGRSGENHRLYRLK